MHRTSNKDSPNVSLSSSNGIYRPSVSGATLMNGNGYRRSPVPTQQVLSHQQPHSFETLGSPSASYNSEEIGETANSFEDDSVNELSLKFEHLQRQVEILTETQTTQDERYKRTRQENDALLNKIHSLEDQIREIEFNSETRAKEDEKRFKDTMAKQMKASSQECEQHLHANFLLQQELFQLKNDYMKSELLIRTLRSEKEALEAELQEKNSELASLDEEIHGLKLLVKNLKDEENVKSNLISILNEELEDSQSRSHREQHYHDQSVASPSHNFNQSPKQRSTSSRRSSVTSGYGDELLASQSNIANNKAMKDIDGLEVSLSKLREENKRLTETNEELQAQLLNIHLEEGRSLVQEGDKSYSLADELGDVDVQKVMKALKEQQDDNARLRKYLNELMVKILDKYPDILDKTSPGQTTATM